MEVKLTPNQEALIQRAIEQGRYQSPEDALRDAIERWEERERQRIDLTTGIGRAEMDMKAGLFTDYTDETLALLAEELKQEAREMRNSLQAQ